MNGKETSHAAGRQERRAWATENEIHHGGEKKGGGGYGKPEDHTPMKKGGRKAGSKRT